MVPREHVCGRGGWATSVSAKNTASGEEVYRKGQFTPPPTLRLKLCPPKKAARPTGLTLVLRSFVTTRRPFHTSPAYRDCATRALVLAPSWRTAYSNGPSVTHIFIRKCFAPRHVHNIQNSDPQLEQRPPLSITLCQCTCLIHVECRTVLYFS